MREGEILARLTELSRLQIIEYLETGKVDSGIDKAIRRLYDEGESLGIYLRELTYADSFGIYLENEIKNQTN